VSELINNFKTAWAGWSRGARALFATMVVAVLAIAVWGSVWTFQTSYQVLFADLDSRDAGAIVQELKRLKVPYKITEGGTKILVDEKSVHETRLRLMGSNVALSGGVGFEIFDNKDVGMTEYTQKINYQRALQGELARTILSINQIKQARVHLVVADTALFKRQKVNPKASVSLVLKPGAELSREQINGIQRLVAAAVPAMDAGSVTVLDQAGVALSAPAEENEDYALANGKFRLKKNAEDYFIRKISAVLDRTFGPGQAIVSVDVTLNLDEVRRTQQTVVPLRANAGEEGGAVVRKRQSVYRNSKGAVTRTVNGDATYANASPDLTSTTDVEYELGKTVEQVVSSPGGIQRVSVGIVVPRMNTDQQRRVQDVVSMIVGYNEARGDAISIQPIDQMTDPLVDAPARPMEIMPRTTMRSDKSPTLLMSLWTNPQGRILVVALVIAALVTGAMITAWWSRRRYRSAMAATIALTEEQRKTRLFQIRSWLEAERDNKGLA
jgi:flagellar M-ring protein FliF